MLQDAFSEITGIFGSIQIKDIIDIAIVTVIIYQLIKLIRNSRAIQLLSGILFLLFIYIFAEILQLNTIRFLMTNVLQIGAIAILVVFQPEIRKALESIGRTRLHSFFLFGNTSPELETTQAVKQGIEMVCEACITLSKEKTGALIVFEKESKLGEIAQTGTAIDALTTSELICNIFFHNSPLHDGAMVIRNGRVLSAGCFLPLSENYHISKQLGTRHRAALGMSESSDAVVVVVSEETGFISFVKAGRFVRPLTPDRLKQLLIAEFITETDEEKQSVNPIMRRFTKGRVNKE